jgi:hypothetical protein
MSNFFGFWSFKAPGHAVAFGIRAAAPGYLMVDQGGRRFAAEAGREPHDTLRVLGDFSPARRHTPGFPVYLVFDASALNAGPLAWTAGVDGYQWSKDNDAEVRAGWISAAATAAELAERLAVPPDVLAETIAAFNRAAASGSDAEFGRPADSMRPLAGGPLYAIPLMPGVGTTAGGPRRDGRARILDRTGNPIAGLFAAGDNGSVWGHLIEHGGALTDGLVFGRIAAAEALKTLLSLAWTGAAEQRSVIHDPALDLFEAG